MPYDNIKSPKKSEFYPLFKKYIFQKTTAGGQIDPTSHPSRFKVKEEDKNN